MAEFLLNIRIRSDNALNVIFAIACEVALQ